MKNKGRKGTKGERESELEKSINRFDELLLGKALSSILKNDCHSRREEEMKREREKNNTLRQLVATCSGCIHQGSCILRSLSHCVFVDRRIDESGRSKFA